MFTVAWANLKVISKLPDVLEIIARMNCRWLSIYDWRRPEKRLA
jgi:hypothetical protein